MRNTSRMNDNSYNSNFGPSTPGAINLISGQTNGIIQATALNAPSSDEIADGQGGFTLIGDAEPLGDVCSNTGSFNAATVREERRRFAQRRGAYLGLVSGRVRSHCHQSERNHGLQKKHCVADHRTD